MSMGFGDTWTGDAGQEMRVMASYWKASKRDEDEERLKARYDGDYVLTDEPNAIETEVEELQCRFYLSVPAAEFSRASSALYGA